MLAFTKSDFEFLGTLKADQVNGAFWTKVEELLHRVNQLECMKDLQITRNKGATSAFEVTPDRMNTQDGHWYVYHFGGREEAQFNIGMNELYLRIGLGFNAEITRGRSGPQTPNRVARAFDAFREAISRRPNIFQRLALREDFRVEGYDAATDDPVKLVAWLNSAEVKTEKWIFVGSLLRRDNPVDLLVVGDWEELLRKINRVFEGLYPFWQFSYCRQVLIERLRDSLDIPETTPDTSLHEYLKKLKERSTAVSDGSRSCQ